MLNRSLRILQFLALFALLFLSACSIEKKIAKSANTNVLKAKPLQTAHVGISIYEPATGKYWYNHDGDKYFVPASNTKIPTCYAAMKYLGDSLVGLVYQDFNDTAINIIPTGDPSLLHRDFDRHPVLDFLKKQKKTILINASNWNDQNWGSGWAWNDYDAAYMAERSPFPVYGNTMQISLRSYKFRQPGKNLRTHFIPDWKVTPGYFNTLDTSYILPPAMAAHRMFGDTASEKKALLQFYITRGLDNNELLLEYGNSTFSNTEIPFWNNGITTAVQVLQHDHGIRIKMGGLFDNSLYGETPAHLTWHKVYSQPADSLLKPMMHRSDNFFAEQSLLMVSQALLGVMNDARAIDTILKTDFKDLPQKPRWADGSGLSRYNLFTPQDMIAILNKMKTEFGMERIKAIFPTGGEGTISSYYKTESGYIYAKTGTLSGVVALSGFLVTKKNKELIFSVLVNNHQASATDVRRAVEKFLQNIRNSY